MRLILLVGLTLFFNFGLTLAQQIDSDAAALAATLPAENPKEHYDKSEHYITMRDGIRLYVAVYTPKDASADNTYPIMLQRTCYSAQPYGPDAYSERFNRFAELANEKYIFVFQDVRGRWMSEGTFDNMRPYIPNKEDNNQIDESSDTYDSIENVIGSNQRDVIWGDSGANQLDGGNGILLKNRYALHT